VIFNDLYFVANVWNNKVRDRKLYYDAVSVRLSVCLSVTLVGYSVEMQWRNYVGSALRQTFPRRPTEFQN